MLEFTLTSEIMDLLKSPFTSYASDYAGYPYIPYEVTRVAADKILGLNYSDETEVSYRFIEEEHIITSKVVITIYDDEGKLVTSRVGIRSEKMSRHSDKHTKAGQLDWTGDAFAGVSSKAFRKAFTKFGLGAQFAESKANASMLYEIEVDSKVEEKVKMHRMKGMVTFVSVTEKDKLFVFHSEEGSSIELMVQAPNKCKNFNKLRDASPGESFEIIFNLDNRELLEVA